MKQWNLFAPLFLCCAAFSQQPSGTPGFEVASIKPSAPSPMGRMQIRMSSDAGMLRYTNVSLKDCIRTAYRVKDFQVQGPDWLGSTRFDIEAKLPDGAKEDQIPEMLQALLAERFKLKLHRDTKEHAIYAMVVGKGGPKLKAAEVQAAPPPEGPEGKGGAPGRSGPPRGNMMMRMDPSGAHLTAPAVTLTNFAEMLSRFSERPVVDMTEIKGQYDFELVFAPETMHGMMGGGHGPGPGPGQGGHPPGGQAADGPAAEPREKAGSIYDAVQRYGLKLDPRKAQMETLTVDQIEKTPTEN